MASTRKVVILGGVSAGKSTLLQKFTRGVAPRTHERTPSVTLHTLVAGADTPLRLQVWDIPGSTSRAVTITHLDAAHAYVLIIDVTCAESVAAIEKLLPDIEKSRVVNAPVFLVAHKIDKPPNRWEVSRIEIAAAALRIKAALNTPVTVHFTSAFDADSVASVRALFNDVASRADVCLDELATAAAEKETATLPHYHAPSSTSTWCNLRTMIYGAPHIYAIDVEGISTLHKRFSDFVALDAALAPFGGAPTPLPPRALVHDAALIFARERALTMYLSDVLESLRPTSVEGGVRMTRAAHAALLMSSKQRPHKWLEPHTQPLARARAQIVGEFVHASPAGKASSSSSS